MTTTKTRPWEQVDVRVVQECGDEPMAFLWRGRLYVVRSVNGTWREAPTEAIVYRVAASTGRGLGNEMVDLRRDGETWTLRQVRD